MLQGRIHSRETFGTVDGPGIRYVLFMQGCPLRCLFCHNPDSQCGAGQEMVGAAQTVEEIVRYKSFIKSGGVTFSGGEPLAQAGFVLEVSRQLHENGFHVAIDTSGCEAPVGIVREAIDEADMLLLDMKAADDETAVALTGQDMTNAFATLDYCEATGKTVWLRHVLLRGYTLEDEKLAALAERLKGYRCIERMDLLPFHKMGEEKWRSLGREYMLYNVDATTKDEAKRAKGFFADCPFQVV